MRRNLCTAFILALATTLAACSKASESESTGAAAPEAAGAADAAAGAAEAAAPDLTSATGFTDALGAAVPGLTPDQSSAALGATLGTAKAKLSPEDYTKVAGAIPGADNLLGAASAAGIDMNSLTDAMGFNSALGKLGLSPDQVSQFVPAVTDLVGKAAGPEVAGLLKSALTS